MKTKNLFIGFKASRAIPVRDTLTRDFLVQSTLDGGVCRIDYQPVPRADDGIVRRGTIILERSDGRFAIDIVLDGRPACAQAAEALLEVAFARQPVATGSVAAPSPRSPFVPEGHANPAGFSGLAPCHLQGTRRFRCRDTNVFRGGSRHSGPFRDGRIAGIGPVSSPLRRRKSAGGPVVEGVRVR